MQEQSSQDRALRDATYHQSPPGHRTTDHTSLAVSIQSICYPSNPSLNSMFLQFGDQDEKVHHTSKNSYSGEKF